MRSCDIRRRARPQSAVPAAASPTLDTTCVAANHIRRCDRRSRRCMPATRGTQKRGWQRLRHEARRRFVSTGLGDAISRERTSSRPEQSGAQEPTPIRRRGSGALSGPSPSANPAGVAGLSQVRPSFMGRPNTACSLRRLKGHARPSSPVIRTRSQTRGRSPSTPSGLGRVKFDSAPLRTSLAGRRHAPAAPTPLRLRRVIPRASIGEVGRRGRV